MFIVYWKNGGANTGDSVKRRVLEQANTVAGRLDESRIRSTLKKEVYWVEIHEVYKTSKTLFSCMYVCIYLCIY
jgi:hypothetical protein